MDKYIKSDLFTDLSLFLDEAPKFIWQQLSNDLLEKNITSAALDKPAVHCFRQTASNTACGWGGVAGRAFTDYWLICLEYHEAELAIVYINRAAYICKNDKLFEEFLLSGKFPTWGDLFLGDPLTILWKAEN